jgi:hypothetical protein
MTNTTTYTLGEEVKAFNYPNEVFHVTQVYSSTYLIEDSGGFLHLFTVDEIYKE